MWSFRVQAAVLSEALDRANEEVNRWKEKFAVQGLQLNNRAKQLRSEAQAQLRERAELQARLDELERRAEQGSAVEARLLADETARLQARADALEAERVALRNALTVADEDRARLDQRCAATRQELGERAASLERAAERLEREKLVRAPPPRSRPHARPPRASPRSAADGSLAAAPSRAD